MYDVPDVDGPVLATHGDEGAVVVAQDAEVDLVQVLDVGLVVLLLVGCDGVGEDAHAAHFVGCDHAFVYHLHQFQQLVFL